MTTKYIWCGVALQWCSLRATVQGIAGLIPAPPLSGCSD